MERRNYLAVRMGDVLTALEELLKAGGQMGARSLARDAEQVASLIRRIIQSSWPNEHRRYLLALQKCGVALMNAVEEKGDLEGVLNSCRAEVQEALSKLGEPLR